MQLLGHICLFYCMALGAIHRGGLEYSNNKSETVTSINKICTDSLEIYSSFL